jgi:hypothetical protein
VLSSLARPIIANASSTQSPESLRTPRAHPVGQYLSSEVVTVMQRIASHGERHSGRPIRLLLLSSALILSLAAPAATMAGKAGAMTPWITLASVSGGDVGALAAAQPRLGSSVRFSTGYPNGTKNPWVSVFCFQDGVMVYGEGGKPSADFVLGGAASVWVDVGGAATCHAELGDLYWRGGHQYYTFLADTWFDAGA